MCMKLGQRVITHINRHGATCSSILYMDYVDPATLQRVSRNGISIVDVAPVIKAREFA